MTSFDRFERSLPALLDELAAPRTPDYFEDILARTAATSQRPGWTFPERWLPMSALSQRLAAVPRVPWRLAGAVALLLLALVIGLLIAGGHQTNLPAPFGPAANGQVLYVDGGIVAGDPVTGSKHVLVPGPGIQRAVYSPDGTRIAFIRVMAGGFELAMARADGSGVVPLNAKPIGLPAFLQWAPDDRTIAITTDDGSLELFDTSRRGEPTVVATDVTVGINQPSDAVANLFRPPSGNELLVVNNVGAPKLQLIGRDGSLIRTLIESTQSSSTRAFGVPSGHPTAPRSSFSSTSSQRRGRIRTFEVTSTSSTRMAPTGGRSSTAPTIISSTPGCPRGPRTAPGSRSGTGSGMPPMAARTSCRSQSRTSPRARCTRSEPRRLTAGTA